MVDKLWNPSLIYILLAAIVILFFFQAKAHFAYTPDDTYIYLQYAKNVNSGNGVCFNVGDPTYGITSPLWLFIISVGGKFGIDLYVAAKSIDLFFACSSLVLFYFVMFELLQDAAIALSATAALSLNVWLLRWAGSGMETSFAVFLLLLTLVFVFRGKYYISIIFVALLSLVRPEAWILFTLILIDVYLNSEDKRNAVGLALRLILIYCVILLPWFVYAYGMFGTIIPNTALAKAGITFTIDDGYATLKDIVQTIGFSDGVAVILFLLSGTLVIAMKNRKTQEPKEQSVQPSVTFRSVFVGVGFIFLLSLFYIIAGLNVISRYLLLITPLILINGFYFLNQIILSRRLSRYRYTIVFIVIGFIVLQDQFIYHKYVKPGIATFEKGMETCLIPIGKWLKENTTPESKVFVQDVGAIGYFSERKICDAAGLVSPNMLSLLREGYTHQQMMQEKIYKTISGCDYVVYRSFRPEEWTDSLHLTAIFTRPFPQMGLAENRINYYTVYKVKHDPQ